MQIVYNSDINFQQRFLNPTHNQYDKTLFTYIHGRSILTTLILAISMKRASGISVRTRKYLYLDEDLIQRNLIKLLQWYSLSIRKMGKTTFLVCFNLTMRASHFIYCCLDYSSKNNHEEDYRDINLILSYTGFQRARTWLYTSAVLTVLLPLHMEGTPHTRLIPFEQIIIWTVYAVQTNVVQSLALRRIHGGKLR